MLERFLEVGIHTADSRDAWERFRALGFEAAMTGDVWSHPYGVVCCEGLSLGLHGGTGVGLDLCFVRPNVGALHRELTARGIRVESAQLGADVFNQLMIREPSGQALRVLEARTFSPPADTPARTLLGQFLCLSLPVREMERAAEFWRRLGVAPTARETPWPGLTVSRDMPLAYHLRRDCAEPLLCFRHADLDLAQAQLSEAGLEPQKGLASLAGTDHLLLRTVEDQALLVLN
jgi:hypothetical protein